jgi:hypothetical protein
MFGGDELVRFREGLTYSGYAREGFFQLVVVAVLALLVLLTMDWCARRAAPSERRLLRILMGILVALVFVVLASALHRMHLYQDAYGFTELRLYTTAFMLWLAVVFLWFSVTVLRGSRERFAFVAVVAALAVVLGLNAFNPDAYIVRANAARMAQGKTFDSEYAPLLSADAVPTLAKILPSLQGDKRADVESQILSWTRDDPPSDWRRWNLSRERARVIAERLLIELRVR